MSPVRPLTGDSLPEVEAAGLGSRTATGKRPGETLRCLPWPVKGGDISPCDTRFEDIGNGAGDSEGKAPGAGASGSVAGMAFICSGEAGVACTLGVSCDEAAALSACSPFATVSVASLSPSILRPLGAASFDSDSAPLAASSAVLDARGVSCASSNASYNHPLSAQSTQCIITRAINLPPSPQASHHSLCPEPPPPC